MNTSLHNREGQLLVDIESGRLLRYDDEVIVSERYLDSHPFVNTPFNDPTTYFVGPDAKRRALARQRNEGENGLDAQEYEVTGAAGVPGFLRLRRVERA